MTGKKPFAATRSQLNVSKSQFKPTTHFVPIHQYRANSSPYTVSTCCSTKYSGSSASGCSCHCSSKSSSNESRQSRIKIKRLRRRQRISYLLIFVIMIICMLILVYIIKNTSELEDIINYFKYAFYTPQPLINEATRKPAQSFTGKPIVWTEDLDKD